MKNVYNSKSEFNDILKLIQKKSLCFEGFCICIKKYFTDNTFYYFICLIFRFIPLILLSGDYTNIFKENNNTKSFYKYLKIFTLHNYINHFKMSYEAYFIINILVYILLIIRIVLYSYIMKNMKNYEFTNNWSLLEKFRIIYDHILFLIFPYIIEFFSFSYYILFFPNNFIIKINNSNYSSLFIIISINTILIILYNINNYIYFICINKTYTTRAYEAYLKITNEQAIISKKTISYRCSSFTIFLLMFLQNFVIIESIENYLNLRNKILFKIIISIILIVIIFMLIFSRINEYNFTNFINISINILFLFCFYSIILDLNYFITNYEINNVIFEIIYVMIKILSAYISYSLFFIKIQNHFESKIIEILFQSKKNEKENNFLNSFYYLHEIMLKVKDDNDINSVYEIINFLNNHINKCNKIGCNCKLLSNVLKKNIENKNKETMKKYIFDLLNVLNYLYENPFIDFDYYNNYELTILLAEHFCNLKNNPTMAFSLIKSLIIKRKNKISKFQMIILYELLQKYIYYISAISKNELEYVIINSKNKHMNHKQTEDLFKIFYKNSKTAIKIKMNITNYIDNHIKILKYKNIFEESIKFNFDETNEIITSVKIQFFDTVSNIDNNFIQNNKKSKRIDKKIKHKGNLYKVIYLLKQEQLFYNSIIKCINNIKSFRKFPVFIIFKYYLFFDIFNGGKIPQEIGNKLYQTLTEKINIYNNYITYNEYSLLKKIYNEQNNSINSKFYSMFEYKNDLRTKYFSEFCALKLGYKQKDIIDEKIDQLMPKKFYESHQNMVKLLIIGRQKKYHISHESYLFDFSSTILYPINQESILIYNISKNLVIMTQSQFKLDNEYKFMLNNNLELMANSKNFEDEFFFNKKILEAYDIKIMDILQIKPSKMNKIFENVFKKIDEQRLIRKAKTEEYFIPQFYVPAGDRNLGMMNPSHFNNAKKNILNKIYNSKNENDNENINDNDNIDYDDERKNFISNDKNKKILEDLFIKPMDIVLHDNYNFIINKNKYIENLYKELAKIPDNDLMFENDKFNYNLIISGKKLINKLIKNKNSFSNNFIRIKIRLSYYYDKPFYFISIDDEKKMYIKTIKGLSFSNNKNFGSGKAQNNMLDKKLKTNFKKITNNNYKHNSDERNTSLNTNIHKTDIDKAIDKLEKEKNEILKKIEKYRKEVNRDKFILIIKIILFIIIIFIFTIYILIIIFQKILIKRSQLILMAYYYNSQTENTLLSIYSLVLENYYNGFNLSNNKVSNYTQQQILLRQYSDIFKDYLNNFTNYYISFNIEVGNNFNLIYNQREFYKIEGFWEEVSFISGIETELDRLLFNLYSINATKIYSGSINNELKNFFFFSNKISSYIKVESTFIKILYYLCVNYEFTYKQIFLEFRNYMFYSFNEYIYSNMNYYFILEILGFLFYYILFFSVIIYLHYSNQIILKNIIFLFLDFSDEQCFKNRLNTNNKIILKLLELQHLIDDFNLENFKKYSYNLDTLNKSKDKDILLNKSFSILNSDTDNKKISADTKKNQSQNRMYNINNFISNKTGRNSIQRTSSKNMMLLGKKDNSKNPLVKMKSITNSDFKANNIINFKNQKLNDSSQHFLIKNNSQAKNEKLNDNSIDQSKELLKQLNNNTVVNNDSKLNNMNNLNTINTISNKKNNNSIDDYIFKSRKNYTLKNDENDLNDNYQDLLLNKSNKTRILIIKIYIIIILLLIIIITIFCVFKIKLTYEFKSLLNYYFIDYDSLINRYTLLTYYFNIFRTLIIFPEGQRKNNFTNIMEDINYIYDKENKAYANILSERIDNYQETKKLFEILQDKHNSTEILREKICLNSYSCESYVNSSYNIFASGVDFAYKTCINQINNIYLDYKRLNSKSNITEIKEKLLKWGEDSHFENIVASINNMFSYVQFVIFETFKIDQLNFKNKFSGNMTLLNIISVVFSILTFLFVNIIIFLSLSNFSKPIKNSTYRINCSFYFIKKYHLSYRKK